MSSNQPLFQQRIQVIKSFNRPSLLDINRPYQIPQNTNINYHRNYQKQNPSKIQIRYSYKTSKTIQEPITNNHSNNIKLLKTHSNNQNRKYIDQVTALKQINNLTSSIQSIFNKIQSIKKKCQIDSISLKSTLFSNSKNSNTPPIQINCIQKQTIVQDKSLLQKEKILTHKRSHTTFQKITIAKQSYFQMNPQLFKSTESILLNPQITIKISDFQLGKTIGSGKFGDVLLCRHKTTGILYAVKKILKSTIKQYNMVSQFIQQLKIHYQINHPNIIQLITHFEDDYHVFMLMQYANGGNILKLKKKPQRQIKFVIKQVIEGLIYLHQKNICHRDIKPQNILFNQNGSIKICDFGWSCQLKQGQLTNVFCGTPDYISPQMKDIGIYGLSVDIWSLGVLAYELIVGQVPLKNQVSKWIAQGTRKNFKFNWNQILYPNTVSYQASSFIFNILKQNPNQRFSLKECKNSSFLNN